jgi:hypothetical protein
VSFVAKKKISQFCSAALTKLQGANRDDNGVDTSGDGFTSPQRSLLVWQWQEVQEVPRKSIAPEAALRGLLDLRSSRLSIYQPTDRRRLFRSIKPPPTAVMAPMMINRPELELAGTSGPVQISVPSGSLAHPVTSSQLSAVQASASSQLSGAIGWQTPTTQASAPLHTSLSRQGTPSSRTSVGQLASEPVHVSDTSQTPTEVRHSVAADSNTSLGQMASRPVHVSTTSHRPANPRHSVAANSKLSAGQLSPEPVHISATSQSPAEARHSVAADS